MGSCDTRPDGVKKCKDNCRRNKIMWSNGCPEEYKGTGYDDSICMCPSCEIKLAPYDLVATLNHDTKQCPECGVICGELEFVNYEEE